VEQGLVSIPLAGSAVALVPVFQERLEVGVLPQIGLHVREPLGDEGLEPGLGEVVVDAVIAVLNQSGRDYRQVASGSTWAVRPIFLPL
jgi:hypothetical protein